MHLWALRCFSQQGGLPFEMKSKSKQNIATPNFANESQGQNENITPILFFGMVFLLGNRIRKYCTKNKKNLGYLKKIAYLHVQYSIRN
jgi:hypothetical protein